MLETVHEYAREKLEESGEAEELRRLHARYFLALALEAEPELKGARQYEWLEHLEAENDNMRALSPGCSKTEMEPGLRLAGALRRFWHVRGYFDEGRRWLEQALAKDSRASASAGPRRWTRSAGWHTIRETSIERRRPPERDSSLALEQTPRAAALPPSNARWG